MNDFLNIRKQFKKRLQEPDPILAPGAFSALSARLIEEAGFECVYVTGAGIANNFLGWADMGLQTMHDVLNTVREIVNVVTIPVIVDVDTGFGGVVNVYRTVREFERVGATAIHIEDQVMPKKCGHFQGKGLIRTEEMIQKIKVAIDTRTDPNFLVIARTDARELEGFESSIERAIAYKEAGADIVFIDALESVEELKLAAKQVDAILLADMVEGGVTPLLPLAELGEIGYKIVIYANSLSRACMKSMQDMLLILKEYGTTRDHLQQMVTWEERQRIVRLKDLQDLESRHI